MKSPSSRTLCLFFFICFLNTNSFAQVGFGLKSGINLSTTKNLIAYPKDKLGWYLGGYAKIPISMRVAFEPELYYSAKGNRSYNQGGPLKITTRLNYVNMPLLLQYNILKNTFLLFGPELGYMTSAQIAYSNGEVFDRSTHYHRKFDIGLAIGITYTILKNMGIDVRYNYGFNTLYSTDINGERYSSITGGNRVLQFGFNYLINP